MPNKELGLKSLIVLPDSHIADCILFLKNNQNFHVFGCVLLRKLVGSLSICGHHLNEETWHSVCGYGSNLISVESSSGGSFDWQNACLTTILKDVYSSNNKLVIRKCSKKLKDVGCIVLLKCSWATPKVHNLYDISAALDIDSLGRCQKELYEKTIDLSFTVLSDVPPQLSSLVTPIDWLDIFTSIQSRAAEGDFDSPVILVCGGKGVGKSTFGRYLINKFLNTDSHLCFLDTDVGQSEFTPPGILSLTVVDKPIFGPPFSHLSRPKKARFFGDVSPRDRPSSYIRFIRDLHQFYKEHHSGVPLIVNTHGWVKGMGVWLLLDIIRIVQPTRIVQISSESEPTKNLPRLTDEFVKSQPGWNYWKAGDRDNSETGWICSSQFHYINAFKPKKEGSKRVDVQPSELRSLSMLSYFGSFQRSSNGTPVHEDVLSDCPVYSQSISNLKFYNVYEDVPPSEMLYSINGSVVGLVHIDDDVASSSQTIARDSRLTNDVPDGEYVGLGIVRNIDPESGVLFIITPEPPHNLRKVNTLVKGRLEIPENMLKKRKCEIMPYLTSEFTYNHRGSGPKKIRYNLLRQKPRSPHSTDDGS